MDLDEMLATPNGVGAWRLDETTLLALVPKLSTRIGNSRPYGCGWSTRE